MLWRARDPARTGETHFFLGSLAMGYFQTEERCAGFERVSGQLEGSRTIDVRMGKGAEIKEQECR